ncbi:hypothetical protein ACFPRL_08015 [Pseudoclavibacter helvolus]
MAASGEPAATVAGSAIGSWRTASPRPRACPAGSSASAPRGAPRAPR